MTEDVFVERDVVTGKRLPNRLNRARLSRYELDEIMLGEEVIVDE